MTDAVLDQIRDVVQEDVGSRGLATVPGDNLLTACAGDFAAACRSLAGTPHPSVAIVTGFYIPHAQPPCGETDGPLGAVFLARALVPAGISVTLLTDDFCLNALAVGLEACNLRHNVRLLALVRDADGTASPDPLPRLAELEEGLTHLIALERVGPSHTPESVRAQPGATEEVVQAFQSEVPAEHHDRCHTMRGRDITPSMAPAHHLVEAAARRSPRLTTIGIGDGGNEIGMGKVPWRVIRDNIPGGGTVACRVPTDYLVVCGVSNWGAYGLAVGVRILRGLPPKPSLFDLGQEEKILRAMVERGPLVDGVTGQPAVTVDALSFERYSEPLRHIGALVSG